MDQIGLYVNIGINLLHYTHAFVNNGCLCFIIALK
jgi:hypothetical protein